MKKLRILMCVLIVSTLFTGVASAHSAQSNTYEIVRAVHQQDLGPARLETSGPISDWYRAPITDSIESSSSVSCGITFEGSLSITLKNEISEFVLGVSYDWQESYGMGITTKVDPNGGDWVRLIGEIHEKKVRVTMQHDVYGDVARVSKSTLKPTPKSTLIRTYFTYEDIWIPYNNSFNLEYANGTCPPTRNLS